MAEWKQVSLVDVVGLKRGFDLPTPQRRPGDYPVLGSSGISGWHDEAPLEGPGVTIGRSGASIGVATWFDGPCWPLNTTLFVEDFKGNCPRFVYRLLDWIDFSPHNSGSAQPSLNRNFIAQIRVFLPPLSEQQAVAAVLGALDDKIAVNERVASAALELAGLQYCGASARDSGDDWRNIALRESANWLSGGTPRTSEPSYWGGEIPWISALSLKSPWIDDSERKLTQVGAESGTRLVPPGTVIFVVRGSSLKVEFRIGLTMREVAFGQDCKALIPREGIDPHLLFHAIRVRTPEILDMVDETSIGAGRLSTDLISKLEVRIPETRDGAVVPALRALDKQAAWRQQESRTLATLRDTLLPQLMSGKLRVRDAERIVEDAV
jgi:type I restriction enzyme S subunit